VPWQRGSEAQRVNPDQTLKPAVEEEGPADSGGDEDGERGESAPCNERAVVDDLYTNRDGGVSWNKSSHPMGDARSASRSRRPVWLIARSQSLP